MFGSASKSPNWKTLIAKQAPVQLLAAHDALTAKLIEQAEFVAYQIGGFALAGARYDCRILT